MIKLKSLLYEDTRERLVLKNSRAIIKAFKSGVSNIAIPFVYSGLKDPEYDPEDAKVFLTVDFVKVSELDYAYSIAAGMDGDKNTMDILIEYNPKYFPAAMNNLVAEVKDTLEHEIEHVGQQNFEPLYIISNRYDKPLTYPSDAPQAPTHFLYLTSNTEVPAYVKGLLKKAAVKKITLDQSMEDYYDNYKEVFNRHNTSWSKVKKIWMDWYNTNRNTPGRTLRKVKT